MENTGFLFEEPDDVIEKMETEFEKHILKELDPLQRIAKEITGENGLQLPSVYSDFKEEYADFETGKVDIKSYLEFVIGSFIDDEQVEDQDRVKLAEVVAIYANEVGLKTMDIQYYDDLHYEFLEHEIFDLLSSHNDSLSCELEYDPTAFNEIYSPIYFNFVEHILQTKFEDYELQVKDVLDFESLPVVLYGHYKFVNEADTICFNDIDWYNLKEQDINIDEIRTRIDWFMEEYEEEEYLPYLKFLEVYERTKSIPSYLDGNGLKQNLIEILDDITPDSGSINLGIKNQDLKSLDSCIQVQNLMYEYYNNGLGNAFHLPSEDEWDAWHVIEEEDEDGNIELVEELSWDEYYDEKLEIEDGYEDYPLIDELYQKIREMRISYGDKTLFSDKISIVLEKGLSDLLEENHQTLVKIKTAMEFTEFQNNNMLDKIYPNELKNQKLTNLEKFDLLAAAATMGKNQEAIEFFNEMENNSKYCFGMHVLFQTHIKNINIPTLMYFEVKDNPFDVDKKYRLNFPKSANFITANNLSSFVAAKLICNDEVFSMVHTMETVPERYSKYFDGSPEIELICKFFAPYNNIDVEMIEELAKSDFLIHNINSGLGLSDGQQQLIDLANRNKMIPVDIQSISDLDASNARIAFKIVNLKELEVTDEVSVFLNKAFELEVEQFELE